jgi:voltage-gated potassium channel
MANTNNAEKAGRALNRERYRLLIRIDRAMTTPMVLLGFAWVGLVVADVTVGISPFLQKVNYGIWALFILQFLVEWVIAPGKLRYLRRHWITAISLLVPAARLLSVARIARVFVIARGTRLLRLVGGANRGMRSLGRVMDRRGFGYVVLLTLIVALAGAAGVFAAERGHAESRFESFGSSLWWAAMTLTTMGTDFFPRSPEGRLLSLMLAIYGFAVFGYVTATVASFFVARDADEADGEIAGARQLAELRGEVRGLRTQLEKLRLHTSDPTR